MKTKTPLFNIARQWDRVTLYLVSHSRSTNGFHWSTDRKAAIGLELEAATSIAKRAKDSYGADCAVIDADDSVATRGKAAFPLIDEARAVLPHLYNARKRDIPHAEFTAAIDARAKEFGVKLGPKEYRQLARVARAYVNERGAERISRTKSGKRSRK